MTADVIVCVTVASHAPFSFARLTGRQAERRRFLSGCNHTQASYHLAHPLVITIYSQASLLKGGCPLRISFAHLLVLSSRILCWSTARRVSLSRGTNNTNNDTNDNDSNNNNNNDDDENNNTTSNMLLLPNRCQGLRRSLPRRRRRTTACRSGPRPHLETQ